MRIAPCVPRSAREAQSGKVAQLFHEFDKDQSGFLDAEEIAEFCKGLGLLLSDAEVSQVQLLGFMAFVKRLLIRVAACLFAKSCYRRWTRWRSTIHCSMCVTFLTHHLHLTL